MSYAQTGRVVGGGLSTAEDRFIFSGGTRPQDLELEMQLLTALLTDPAFRSQAFNQMKANYPAAIAMTRATPGGVFGMDAAPLLAGGDRRKAPPPAPGAAQRRFPLPPQRPWCSIMMGPRNRR